MKRGKEIDTSPPEAVAYTESLLGEPRIPATPPNLEIDETAITLGLPFMVFEGKTMRIPNGKKIGKLVRASVPLKIPREQPVRGSRFHLTYGRRPPNDVRSPEQRGNDLLDALLENQIRTLNGVEIRTAVCHFSYETFVCLFHPGFGQAVTTKTSGGRRRLPTITEAQADREQRLADRNQAFIKHIDSAKEKPFGGEKKLLSDVGMHLVEAASTFSAAHDGLHAQTRMALHTMRKMFKSSDFSVKDLVGTDGIIRHRALIGDLDFELSLDPLSPQGAALLQLCQAIPEAVAPGLHVLTRALAANDLRVDQAKNPNANHSHPQQEPEFFKPELRKIPEQVRLNIIKMRARYTDMLRAAIRNQRAAQAVDSSAMLSALLGFHDVACPPNSPYLTQQTQLIAELAVKDSTELSHEEIAFLLSVAFERSTSSQASVADAQLDAKVAELNEAGLFYFNMDFYDVHDPNTFHGAFATLSDGSVIFDWCPIHTPPLAAQLSNLSLSLPTAPLPTVALPPLGLTEALGGAATFGQGLPLLAQAFAFGGASLGSILSSSGERSSGMRPAGSAPKPERAAITRKKTRSRVIFPSPGRGSATKQETRSQKKITVRTLKPRPKERAVKRPTKKQIETAKLRPTAAPALPKKNEIQIVVAQRREAPKAVRAIKKEKKPASPKPIKPPAERAKHPASQLHAPPRPTRSAKPKLSPSRELSRKAPTVSGLAPSRRRVREIPKVIVPVSFAKRLERVFQVKRTRAVSLHRVEAKITAIQSQLKSTDRHQTALRKAQKLVKVVRKHEQARSLSEFHTKSLSAPAQRATKKVRRTIKQTAKEISRVPAISARSTKSEKKTKVQPTLRSETKKQAKKAVATAPPALAHAHESSTKTEKNLLTVAVALVGAALFETAKRVAPSASQELSKSTTATIDTVPAVPTQDAQAPVVEGSRARTHAEHGHGRGGSTTKKRTQAEKTTQQADPVLLATMQNSPSSALIDVSDSFNTAREVKMWAQEAAAYPKLMQRYYAKAV